MAATAIHVENLCKQYGPVRAVDEVSFRLEVGELVGFLGLNGAGKSTTMKILTTFMPASSGVARIFGFDVMNESMEVRQHLGYLPESVPLYPEFRVEEYLTARAKMKGVSRTVRTARIEHCLERCRIREVRRRLIGTLSKGYRQRVGLADAMLANPPVLILDEPLSGLDPIQQEETLQTIRALGGEHTVLFSSHQLTDVEKVCDRVMIIHRGQLQFDGRLSEIARRTPTLLVEVRGPVDAVESAIRQSPDVNWVELKRYADGLATFEVRADSDIRERLVRTLIEKGWGVLHVELRREKLEDTFMKVAYGRGLVSV